MLNQPAFHPRFHVEIAHGDTVFLLCDTETQTIQNRSVARVAALIDGQTTTDELLDRLDDELAAHEVYYALLTLEKQGYLIEATPALTPVATAFLATLPLAAQTAEQRVRDGAVALHNFTDTPTALFAEKMASYSVVVAAEGDRSALDIVLVDDYLAEELDAFNQRALATGRPWLLARPAGRAIWVGPVFRPGQTGCWACLADRLRNHRNAELYLRHQQTVVVTRPTRTAPSGLGLDLLAQEAFKAIVLEAAHDLTGALLTADGLTLQTARHVVVQRPQCPSCGDPTPYATPTPLVLTSQQKHVASYGGDRVTTPEETLARYGHHVSPVTGIIHTLKRQQTPDGETIHAYVAGINHAVSSGHAFRSVRHLRSESGGKGTTAAQAQVGALCEALERHSGRLQGYEPRLRASYQELGTLAIHPNTCMRYSDTQYQHRVDWNRSTHLPHLKVPAPFDPQAPMDWSPVWSLTREAFVYLPTSLLYYGYPFDPDVDPCCADSNGSAAGNTREEAILQGFLELIERDAIAIWWYNRLTMTAVDVESFALPYVTQLREQYRALHREFHVLDLTTDFGVPTFAAISRAVGQPEEQLICGFGAHFNPETALLRALTEMNQFLPLLTHWNQHRNADPLTTWWWKQATFANQPHFRPATDRPATRADEYLYERRDDLLDDVRACQQLVEAKGMELLVLDQTRPDVGLPVVKVIVPGLYHFWNRLGSGRLYEVPVQLGWLDQPRCERDLNPISIFF